MAEAREEWIRDKLAQIHDEYDRPRYSDERRSIKKELQKLKWLTTGSGSRAAMPSSQIIYQRLQRLLERKKCVPAWVAEAVRLLYDGNDYPFYMQEKLRRAGWDVAKVNRPALSEGERRVRAGVIKVEEGEEESYPTRIYQPKPRSRGAWSTSSTLMAAETSTLVSSSANKKKKSPSKTSSSLGAGELMRSALGPAHRRVETPPRYASGVKTEPSASDGGHGRAASLAPSWNVFG